MATRTRLIHLFGGAPGIPDRGALKAALARPRTGYYQDVVEEAAALLESLWQNHPFVDGNKRTAVTVAAAFLRVNGFRLDFDDSQAFRFLMGLSEEADFRLVRLEPCLRAHVTNVTPE